MDFLIQKSMRPDTTSREIIDEFWRIFVPPDETKAGNLRRYLVQWRTLLDPAYAAKVLHRPHSLARLYSALRFGRKFDVSLSSLVGGLTIKRTTRDRRSRHYLISRSLLDQELADGGKVTAAHLGNIIGHLDDYV